MEKIKNIKMLAETDDGKVLVVMDNNYENAEISFERDFKETSFDGAIISVTPTNTYHIIIRDYLMKE